MEATVSYLLMKQKYTSSKQKKPEIKDYALCLDNILQLIIWKKTGQVGVVKFFSVDFIPIDTNDILGIH